MKEAAPPAAIHTVFEVDEGGCVRAVETLSEEVGLIEGLESVAVGDRIFEGAALARRIGHYAARARTLGKPLSFDRHHWSPKGLFHFEVGVWPKAEGGFSVAVSPLAGADMQLRREALHRDIVEYANDAIMVCEGDPIDSPGPRILFVNPAFERVSGYTAAEVVGCSPRILQGPRTDRAALDRIRAALQQQSGVGVELLNYRKDGSAFWAELRLEPVRDEAGWLTHWIGFQRDVTARREGERWLHLLISGLDQVQKCLLLTEGPIDGEGPRIAFANASAAQLLGASEAALVGRSLASLWAPDAGAEATALTDAMRSGAVADGAIRCQRGTGGSSFWLNWHLGLPIRNEAGGPPHFLLIAHDSTQERLTAAERLRTARSDTLTALARGVVHNFNNKLAGVIGALSLARLKVAEGDLRILEALIRQADESAAEAAAVAAQLQAFARGEGGGRTAVTLAPLLRDLVAFTLQGSAILAEFHLDPAAPAVLAEPASLQQCLAALAVNARESMPGPGRLIVRLEGTELTKGEAPGLSAGAYVRISLQDNGTPRPHADLERLLELELPAVPDPREFGLAAASAFAREHGGSLTALPLPERGTVFTLLLPAAPPPPAPPSTVLNGRGRILAQDDEATVRQTFVRLAAEAGYEATAVAGASELLDLYGENLRQGTRFEAVVVDLTSPGGEGGIALLRRLLELDPQARVIVSSGYAEPAAASGAVAFLPKPYRLEDLSQVLARALRTDAPTGHAPV